jgi:tetratricopeptide (TPR) repeat protein
MTPKSQPPRAIRAEKRAMSTEPSTGSRFPATPLIAALALLLAACGWQPTREDPEVAERVRAPAGGAESEGLQVYPLRNAAVVELENAAEAARSAGDLERADELLSRALRIEPRDPELLQRMAELQLARGDWAQAEHHAMRSFELGPRVGELCRRNWEAVALARERQGRMQEASRARSRTADCPVEPPERF